MSQSLTPGCETHEGHVPRAGAERGEGREAGLPVPLVARSAAGVGGATCELRAGAGPAGKGAGRAPGAGGVLRGAGSCLPQQQGVAG